MVFWIRGCRLESYWWCRNQLEFVVLFVIGTLLLQVSGSKFYYLKNEAVLLEMALINWTLSEVVKRGFTPLTTPEIVRSSVVEKCGFQPCGTNTQVCWRFSIFSCKVFARWLLFMVGYSSGIQRIRQNVLWRCIYLWCDENRVCRMLAGCFYFYVVMTFEA